jgi:hypothetical protein
MKDIKRRITKPRFHAKPSLEEQISISDKGAVVKIKEFQQLPTTDSAQNQVNIFIYRIIAVEQQIKINF